MFWFKLKQSFCDRVGPLAVQEVFRRFHDDIMYRIVYDFTEIKQYILDGIGKTTWNINPNFFFEENLDGGIRDISNNTQGYTVPARPVSESSSASNSRRGSSASLISIKNPENPVRPSASRKTSVSSVHQTGIIKSPASPSHTSGSSNTPASSVTRSGNDVKGKYVENMKKAFEDNPKYFTDAQLNELHSTFKENCLNQVNLILKSFTF